MNESFGFLTLTVNNYCSKNLKDFKNDIHFLIAAILPLPKIRVS